MGGGAELLSRQMKISSQPNVRCCVAITGQRCIVLLHDPVTPVGAKVEEGWMDFCVMGVSVQGGPQCDHSRALGVSEMLRTALISLISPLWETKRH